MKVENEEEEKRKCDRNKFPLDSKLEILKVYLEMKAENFMHYLSKASV